MSECYKDGIYSMTGFSGNVEYYCGEHYHEMEDMAEMIFGGDKTKDGLKGILGLMGIIMNSCS